MQSYRTGRKIAQSFYLTALMAAFVVAGCNSDNKPDVDNVVIELETRRLDRDLASLDTGKIRDELEVLKRKYPDFLDFYLDTLMGFGIRGNYDANSDAIRLGLKPFLIHTDIRGVFDSVAQHFPDTKETEKELTRGFRYLKHYFPDYHVPQIVYFISGLNQWSVMTLDSAIIGIGLDMYLGSQYPFYSAVQIPQYVIRKCTPAYIAPNTFQAIYREKYPFVMEDRNLLDLMIQRGKEQYFLSRILPDQPDSVRFGFTQAQLNWCEANEPDVYNFFITQNLLYETSPNKIYRYIFDAPSAAGMPPESPGNIGSWIGYRIITAYLKQHPEMTMPELFAMDQAQKILQDSRYKPR